MIRLLAIGDIHYACGEEQARGDYESRAIPQPVLRGLVWAFRHFIWCRDPFAGTRLLPRVVDSCGEADLAVGLGDYSCDSAFVGLSDDASFKSARECLSLLRSRFGDRWTGVVGDHEYGKLSIFGGVGGLRLESRRRAVEDLALSEFWSRSVGRYRLMGVASPLVAWPVFEPESLPDERDGWRRLREEHLDRIRREFESLGDGELVVLFCHDPTALPFLWREEAVRRRADRIEATILGHLHSNLALWTGRRLAGFPRIGFLGNTVRRYSGALNDARLWKPFKVRLCPALAGIQLLKDGGCLRLALDPDARRPLQVERMVVP